MKHKICYMDKYIQCIVTVCQHQHRWMLSPVKCASILIYIHFKWFYLCFARSLNFCCQELFKLISIKSKNSLKSTFSFWIEMKELFVLQSKLYIKNLLTLYFLSDTGPGLGSLPLTHLPLDKMIAILADHIFRCIFLNEMDKILIQISLKLVPSGQIDNKPAFVQVMVWRWTGDKPLPEPMMAQFTDAYMRHQGRWVNHDVG